jgi:hypothetical protein
LMHWQFFSQPPMKCGCKLDSQKCLPLVALNPTQ